jgi:hypothetical protein
MPDLISLSAKVLCGGNDFRCPFLKEGRLSVGKEWNYGVEKSRYALENKIPSKPLKHRIEEQITTT